MANVTQSVVGKVDVRGKLMGDARVARRDYECTEGPDRQRREMGKIARVLADVRESLISEMFLMKRRKISKSKGMPRVRPGENAPKTACVTLSRTKERKQRI